MTEIPRVVPLIRCPQALRGVAMNVDAITRGIGRFVVLALLGVRMDNFFRPDAGKQTAWCSECGRYYNPTYPHACKDKEIIENRTQLEKWLGTYTIKEG